MADTAKHWTSRPDLKPWCAVAVVNGTEKRPGTRPLPLCRQIGN